MPKRLPEVLTRDEARLLLRMPNPRYPTGARDLCMIKLMLNSGLRAAEVLNLAWQDVDLHTGRLTVRQGKGKKDRQVWINEDTLEMLRT
jgi:integrase/recombinase XerD